VFEGGPVEASSILALYRTSSRRKGTRQVSGDVYAVLDETALKEALASGAGTNGLRFYSGYAGWGPGQLDNEVDAGAWSVLPGDVKTVFDGDPDTLWDRLNRRREQQVVKNRGGDRLVAACLFRIVDWRRRHKPIVRATDSLKT